MEEISMEQNYIDDTQALLKFIEASPTSFQATAETAHRLKLAGFTELDEKKRFNCKAGGKYYVSRNCSAIIAFILPETEPEEISIIAAHTDSPSFYLKVNPEIVIENKYTVLNTEGYGGMLIAPWFDRPLSLAGRAFVKSGKTVEERLVNFDRDLVAIVNLAIHQNRKANDGKSYSKQKDSLPILALGNHKNGIKQLLAQQLGVKEDNLADYDLFLYNRMKGTIWGLEGEFFSSPRIDDLQCAYCGLEALLASKKQTNSIKLLALMDNEEVGSGTKQGAMGDFLLSTVRRIGYSLGLDEEQRLMLQSKGFMLSADNGHALHPNYREACDPVNHPVPNGGILIKHSANQKYTTDAFSAAMLKTILDSKNIPYQEFVNNSDQPGGSTLGNLANMHLSLPTVDIGVAQLAMHSPYETGGVMDTSFLKEGMTAFYDTAR
jgi:aspartyl aminopeptidase